MYIINYYKNPEDPDISLERFKRAYPSVFLHPKPIKITASVHCELTVVMHKLTNSAENLIPVEGGVSKLCCHMCGAFIKKIDETCQKQIFVSGLQGKVQAGWRFPPATPLGLQRAIIELVKKEVDELRYFANLNGRSDSYPTPDSDDEARASDREIEVSPGDFFGYDEC